MANTLKQNIVNYIDYVNKQHETLFHAVGKHIPVKVRDFVEGHRGSFYLASLSTLALGIAIESSELYAIGMGGWGLTLVCRDTNKVERDILKVEQDFPNESESIDNIVE